MALLEDHNVRVIDKFNGENFNLWNPKLEMQLASMDLWNIVDKYEEIPPSNNGPKWRKNIKDVWRRQCPILCSTWQTIDLHTLGGSRRLADVWRVFCNIHVMRSLLNILFIIHKFFTCKIQKNDDLLDHINKVKAFADKLDCLKVHVRKKDVVMTLLKSLLPSYEHLIIMFEMMLMKKLTMKYMTTCMSDAWDAEEECEWTWRW